MTLLGMLRLGTTGREKTRDHSLWQIKSRRHGPASPMRCDRRRLNLFRHGWGHLRLPTGLAAEGGPIYVRTRAACCYLLLSP